MSLIGTVYRSFDSKVDMLCTLGAPGSKIVGLKALHAKP